MGLCPLPALRQVIALTSNQKNLGATAQAAASRKPVPSQTLIRGLDIIEAVAAGTSDLSDIAAHTGMTYSTAHRIVSALLQRAYLRRDPGRGYMLGRKLLELGFTAYSSVELTRLARPILQQLADNTSDTVHLVTMEQDCVVYLDKIPSRRAVDISSRIGGSKPLISTGVGKALLMGQPESDWLRVFDAQEHLFRRPVARDTWLATMRQYARQGYAFDTGEDELVIRCVAAPIRDGRADTVAAISVSSTIEFMDSQRMQELVPLVQDAARRISVDLGFT